MIFFVLFCCCFASFCLYLIVARIFLGDRTEIDTIQQKWIYFKIQNVPESLLFVY